VILPFSGEESREDESEGAPARVTIRTAATSGEFDGYAQESRRTGAEWCDTTAGHDREKKRLET